jgi:hypothetical protein
MSAPIFVPILRESRQAAGSLPRRSAQAELSILDAAGRLVKEAMVRVQKQGHPGLGVALYPEDISFPIVLIS